MPYAQGLYSLSYSFLNGEKESQPKLVGSALEMKDPFLEMVLLCQVSCNSHTDSDNIIVKLCGPV